MSLDRRGDSDEGRGMEEKYRSVRGNWCRNFESGWASCRQRHPLEFVLFQQPTSEGRDVTFALQRTLLSMQNLLHTSCLTPFDHVFLRHERGWRCRKRSGGQVQFYEGHWCRDFEAVTSAKDIHWNFVLFSNTKRLLSEGTSVTPRRQYRDEQI